MYENDTACWWLGVVGDGNERVEHALCFGVDEDHGYSFQHPGFPQRGTASTRVTEEWTLERASLVAEVLAFNDRGRVPVADVLVEGCGSMNMPCMSVTAAVFQLLMSWLKAVAPLNMYFMVVTAAVFHLLMSWLKEVAPENIDSMFVTFPVFHLLMSWLKEAAPKNMAYMSVT